MNKLLKYGFLLSFAIAAIAVSCDDMNDIQQKYLDTPETNYLGKPYDAVTHGGKSQVVINWKLNSDPKIKYCRIYWNDGADSVVHTVTRIDTMETAVITLPESSYNFTIVSYDKSGKEKSLPTVISGRSYGDMYAASLTARGISNVSATFNGVVITWESSSDSNGSTFTYTTTSDVQKTINIAPSESSTTLTDAKLGTEYSYTSSFYTEEGSTDEIETLPVVGKIPSYYDVTKADWDATYAASYTAIAKTGWTATATTEELVGEGTENGRAAAMIDGNDATFWHSQWKNVTVPALPHTLIVDMLSSQSFQAIQLARRSGNKDTKTIVFSVSDDEATWTEIGFTSFPDNVNPNAQIIAFPSAFSGRYLRLQVTEVNNTGRNASIGEVTLYTKP